MKNGDMVKGAIDLLCHLIEIPSYSRDEAVASGFVADYLAKSDIAIERYGNNICCYNRYYDPNKETILLNSHIDTVRPWSGGEYEPHKATMLEDRIYGLGSNDAGASLVSLIEVFCMLHDREDMRYNLALAISAEEEVSGKMGMEHLVQNLRPISFAIVGEPTSLTMAISERGLMVVDCLWQGRAGHAARGEGDNAIYKALEDMIFVRDYRFDRLSPTLGATTMNLTILSSGTQHNVVPDECRATIDIRISDSYSFEDVIEILEQNISCQVKPRSMRLCPSSIDPSHPIVEAARGLGIGLFGSPTLSDQALMPFPSVKIGPGDSARSHSTDEFILLADIEQGIDTYIKLLEKIL